MQTHQEDLLKSLGFEKIKVGAKESIFERTIKIIVTETELRANETERATATLVYQKESEPQIMLAMELTQLRSML